jgi:dienelactone hydrolase
MKQFLKLLLAFALFFSFNLNAQKKSLFSEVTFITSDSITISASYQYPKNTTQKWPAIILIHQGGSTREEWLDLPLVISLLEGGYAILAYDIRQHGKSGKDKGTLYDLFNNPKRAPLDLLAAIQFLEKDDKIDSNRIGILGASIGANLACVAAASDDYNVKSVVSISAKTSAAKNLGSFEDVIPNKDTFFIASKEEQNGLRAKWANELFAKTKAERKVEIAEGDKHGSFILRASESLQKSVTDWFEKTL